MLLSELHNFEWYNEPENVAFRDKCMHVVAEAKTDFWQSRHRGFGQDNGHFFFSRKEGDFSFVTEWSFSQNIPYSQCGLMLRINEKNWIKASIMHDNPNRPMLTTSVTQNGFSDLATQDISKNIERIWFKLKKINGDYQIYHSLDGEAFKQIRLVHLQNDMPEVKVGAYICSPTNEKFEAILSQLTFENG